MEIHKKNKAKADKLGVQLFEALTSKMKKLNEEDKLTDSHIVGEINNLSNKIREFGTSALLIKPGIPIDGFKKSYKEILDQIERL